MCISVRLTKTGTGTCIFASSCMNLQKLQRYCVFGNYNERCNGLVMD